MLKERKRHRNFGDFAPKSNPILKTPIFRDVLEGVYEIRYMQPVAHCIYRCRQGQSHKKLSHICIERFDLPLIMQVMERGVVAIKTLAGHSIILVSLIGILTMAYYNPYLP